MHYLQFEETLYLLTTNYIEMGIIIILWSKMRKL